LVSIYSVQGELLLQQQLNQGKTEIDINGLASGVYFVKATNGEKIAVTRIIKEDK
jgi:hypothetical protein